MPAHSPRFSARALGRIIVVAFENWKREKKKKERKNFRSSSLSSLERGQSFSRVKITRVGGRKKKKEEEREKTRRDDPSNGPSILIIRD